MRFGGRPDVTIVVPAYNVDRYLSACLDSLIGQSAVARCRVLLVDDGSTDATAAIADDYAREHPWIEVVHQRNGGPGAGAARNHGLALVRTRYVLFLDGDDELTPRAVELLAGALDRYRLPLAVGATEQFPLPRSWPWSGYFGDGGARPVAIEEVPLLAHDARSCNKLYRTGWLRRSRLRFAERIHHQDTVVNVPAMLRARRLALVGEVVHRYRKRDDGTSVMDHQFTRIDNYWDHLLVIEQLAAMRPGIAVDRRPLLDAFIARSFQGYSWRAAETLAPRQLPEFFARARAVIAPIDVEVIAAATRDAHDRAGYVTLREDDLDSFLELPRRLRELRVERGDLYLNIPASPANLPLIKTGPTRVWIDRLRVEAGRPVVDVRLRILGCRHLGEALDGRLAIRVCPEQGQESRFPVTITGASGTAGSGTGNAISGSIALPSEQLVAGRQRLRLVFSTDTGVAERWVRRPPQAEVESIHLGDGAALRIELSTVEDGVAALTVAAATP